MVVSPRTLDQLGARAGGSVEDEYFTRPYSAESLRWRVEAMCIRSQTVDDGSGPDPPGRHHRGRRLDPPRDGHRRLQPEGRRRQDDRRDQPRLRAPDPQGPERPARRRRHRDRPRHDVARHRGGPHGRRQLARRARGRPDRVADRHRRRPSVGHAGRRADLVAAAHRDPRAGARRRRDQRRPARLRLRRRRPAPVVQHAEPGDLREAPTASSSRSRRTCRPSGPPSSCRDVASELGIRDRLALVINRANSGVSVADMERTVGMPALAPCPVRRHALRPRRERGPDGHRDVPQGEDHRGLRCPRRSPPRDPTLATPGRVRAVQPPKVVAARPAPTSGSFRLRVSSPLERCRVARPTVRCARSRARRHRGPPGRRRGGHVPTAGRQSGTRQRSDDGRLGGPERPAWIHAHGPRRTNTATIPARPPDRRRCRADPRRRRSSAGWQRRARTRSARRTPGRAWHAARRRGRDQLDRDVQRAGARSRRCSAGCRRPRVDSRPRPAPAGTAWHPDTGRRSTMDVDARPPPVARPCGPQVEARPEQLGTPRDDRSPRSMTWRRAGQRGTVSRGTRRAGRAHADPSAGLVDERLPTSKDDGLEPRRRVERLERSCQ